MAGYGSGAVWWLWLVRWDFDLVTHRPALGGVRGMSQGDATATSEGQEGRERNPWIKSRPRLDLQGMKHFPDPTRHLARALAVRAGRKETDRCVAHF